MPSSIRSKTLLISAFISLFYVSTSYADDGTSLFQSDNLVAAKLYGDGTVKEMISVQGQSFKSAIRVSTKKSTVFPYDILISIPTTKAVKQGDVLLGRFYARCSSGSKCKGRIVYVFNQAQSPYQPSIEFPVVLTSSWQQFVVPFIAYEDYGLGESRVRFHLGGQPQDVEIAGIETLDYKHSKNTTELPQPHVTYLGRESNASWRKAATQRINSIRKGPLKVTIRDAKSKKPIPGAHVEIKMKRHSFAFGAAVSTDPMQDQSLEGKAYREKVKELFNTVTIESDLKWPRWEKDRERALNQVKWLRENDIPIRGHALIWGSWNHLKNVLDLKDKPNLLRQKVQDHIIEEVGRLRGQVISWDVLNEPFTNPSLTDVLGKESMVDWLKLTHETDQQAKLFLNDEGIDPDSLTPEHQEYLQNTIKMLIEKKAPLDGVGLQGHFGWELTPIEKAKEVLDQLGKFHKDIQITEFDMNISDERLQADYTRDFMTLAFSHPSVTGFILWTFTELPDNWTPMSALFHRGWTPKPNGKEWLELVFNKWWTNAKGITNKIGVYTTRGFLGNYEITARHKDNIKNQSISLSKEGRDVTFEF